MIETFEFQWTCKQKNYHSKPIKIYLNCLKTIHKVFYIFLSIMIIAIHFENMFFCSCHIILIEIKTVIKFL